MKRSEAYHLAQIAVVQTPSISPENKLEILKILSLQEHFERYCEEEKPNEAL
jgi:hypothetical protein